MIQAHRLAILEEVMVETQEGLMYHKIVVPLDGSEFGERALPLALSIASDAGAAIHLLHVCAEEKSEHRDFSFFPHSIFVFCILKLASYFIRP